MKTKIVVFSLSLIGLVSMTGCKDFSSARAVVRTAGEALKKNDLADFQETLAGKALQEWGTPDGMSKLQQHLNVAKKLTLSKGTLISHETIDSWNWNQTFKVQVSGDGKPLAETATFCKNKKWLEHDLACHLSCYTHNGQTVCQDICHPVTKIRVSTFCRITDIFLR